MAKVRSTSNAKKGGLFVGKSHDDGGMPAIVVNNGQPIEVEGGEVIINKEAVKKHWKTLSAINQSAGNGVPIPPPSDYSSQIEKMEHGGNISLKAINEGTRIEMEHKNTIKKFKKGNISLESVARSIAKDHLKENPNYYNIISKLKLKKGGSVVCRRCGEDWDESDVENGYTCTSCGCDNVRFYKTGGSVKGLIAPNGKPSNLSPEQYHLVRTSEFKAWFGDWENDPENSSKVIDENGEPLVVYHGSKNKFNIFDLNKRGTNTNFSGLMGFFFSDSKNVSRLPEYYSRKGDLHHCFLRVINPKHIRGKQFTMLQEYEDKRNQYISDENDGLIISPFTIEEIEQWKFIFNDSPINEFRTTQYVAFYPNQIKLADGTNTTFDSNNPDIRFENGGIISDEEKESIYEEWKSLVNMSSDELKEFYDSEEGKIAGLSSKEAKELGIDNGRKSARWILKMKSINHNDWTPNMWKWAKKQISFIKRMSGVDGDLYNDKGKKTPKYLALLIWGNNPEKFANGGGINPVTYYPKTLQLAEYLENNGVNVRTVISNTNFGHSDYVYATLDFDIIPTDGNSVKFRISDHDVSNIDRIRNELHYGRNGLLPDASLKNALNEVRFYSDTSKYFDHDIVTVNFTTEHFVKEPLSTDEIVSQETTPKGKIMYNVKRPRQKRQHVYKIKGTDEVFTSFPVDEIKEANRLIQLKQKELRDSLNNDLEFKSWLALFLKGKTIKSSSRTYQTLEEFISKDPKREFVKQFNLGGGAFEYYYIYPIDGYTSSTNYLRDEYLDYLRKEVMPNYMSQFKKGGTIMKNTEKEKIYSEYKALVNIPSEELASYMNSRDARREALTPAEIKKYGIKKGKHYIKQILILNETPVESWTDENYSKAKEITDFICKFTQENRDWYSVNGSISNNYRALMLFGHDCERYEGGGSIKQNKISKVMHEFREGKLYSSNGKQVVLPKQALAIALSEAGVEKKEEGGLIGDGDCYVIAGKIALNNTRGLKGIDFIGEPYLVHAEVTGQGEIAGIRYGHAWIEDNELVYDFSNGNEIILPKTLYYSVARVVREEPKYYRYTFKEAQDKMLSSGHYGYWDLKTETGL